MTYLLTHDTEALLLKLVGLSKQWVERLAHPHVVAGQGGDSKGSDMLQSGHWVIKGGGGNQEVGVVHVLRDPLEQGERLVPVDRHGDLAQLPAYTLLEVGPQVQVHFLWLRDWEFGPPSLADCLTLLVHYNYSDI